MKEGFKLVLYSKMESCQTIPQPPPTASSSYPKRQFPLLYYNMIQLSTEKLIGFFGQLRFLNLANDQPSIPLPKSLWRTRFLTWITIVRIQVGVCTM